ncbi:MAG: coproporphyrinogen dehydrogenase HemZ [Intestinibacillus sp.]
MNYILQGHDYRHAVEEMLLHLLPTEIPVSVPYPEGDTCVSSLTEREGTARAAAHVTIGGQTREAARETAVGGCDVLTRRRRENEIIKLSIYDAIAPTLPAPPVWGSLTGVRPAKLARGMMERGMTNAEVAVRLREHFYVSPARTALTVRAAAVALDCKAQLSPDEVSVYVGIPFCPSRCAYCSFVSSTVERAAALIPPYLEALCAEIEMTGRLLAETGRRVTTLYIGGGTPTTLSAPQLSRLMRALANAMDFSALREYTVEAGRPDTITRDKLEAIRDGGATRISINPQTMNDKVLRRIGRRHSAGQVLESYALAREIGFSCINMDTIAGLSGDTPDSFARTIGTLTNLKPENITVHTLAIKRAADLSDKAEAVAKRGTVSAMLDDAAQQLTAAGYAPYYLYRQKFTAGGFENVGWCVPGTESLYNVYMMEELQTIVSLGAGAVSKRCDTATGKITRFANPKYPTEYLSAGDRIAAARKLLLMSDGA